jgi:protein-disulfide isomerase
MKKKRIVIFVAGVALTGFLALVAHNYNAKISTKFSKNIDKIQKDQTAEQSNAGATSNDIKRDEKALDIQSDDIVYGDKTAPVVMIEYASLSCPHCSTFYREAFEKLKEEYIDSKKVQFVYRDFPLNQPALSAGMLAVCHSKNPEDYYGFVKVLFKTQDSWAFDSKYLEKLEGIAKLESISSEGFKRCMENKELQSKILNARIVAAKSLHIQSTPTFFINGEASEGYVDYLTLKKIIDKKLQEIK